MLSFDVGSNQTTRDRRLTDAEFLLGVHEDALTLEQMATARSPSGGIVKKPAPPNPSAKSNIEKHHHQQAHGEPCRRLVCMAVVMRLGNDFVADDVEHRAGRKGQRPW